MKIIWIVLKKELMDMFRDRKTIIMSIVIPLILYPILFGIMSIGMDSQTKDVEKAVKIVIVDDGNTKLGAYLKSRENLKQVEAKNGKEAINDGKAYVYLNIPADIDKGIKEEKDINLEILYDKVNTKSQVAMDVVQNHINNYSKEIVKERLEDRKININILTPINIVATSIQAEENAFGKIMMSMLLPMMILMLSITAPITSALDLGAGEKERGTLEPLLTTQASRLSLLWGKFFAIVVMGILGILSSMIGLIISGKSAASLIGGILKLTPITLILITLIAIGVTMVFASLALAISMYARSFKEAQTYTAPLTFVSFIGFVSYFIDVKNISLISFNIPLYNIVAVIKEMVLGIIDPLHIIMVFAWIIVYIIVSILFARYVFGREDAIFRT